MIITNVYTETVTRIYIHGNTDTETVAQFYIHMYAVLITCMYIMYPCSLNMKTLQLFNLLEPFFFRRRAVPVGRNSSGLLHGNQAVVESAAHGGV